MRRLVLIRHGESVWNAEGRVQGQQCAGLSSLGRQQSQLVAAAVAASNPTARLVTSDLQRARETFPYVLIDTPALLAVSDASIVAPFVDGVILVIRAESTKEDEVVKARQMIECSGCRIVGTVLNRFDLRYGIGNQKYLSQYVTRT